MSFRTIEWRDNKVIMIDQTRLPAEEVYNEYTDFQGVAEAIRGMVVRGAPAIGIAAAMGVALGAREIIADSVETMVSAHQFDALICIPNCDKIVPGMLMGAMRCNIPKVGS